MRGVGFTVLSATDGQRGVDLFRAHADEILLVLLDVTMPRMNGEEVLRRIREIRPDIKVILCSGDVPVRLGKSVNACVRKPYEMASVLRTVRGVLEGRT